MSKQHESGSIPQFNLRLISKATLAEYLAASPRTVDRLIAKGSFPAGIKIGGSVRWPLAVVNKWLLDHKNGHVRKLLKREHVPSF